MKSTIIISFQHIGETHSENVLLLCAGDLIVTVHRQCHLLKLEKLTLGLKCKYICRKLHEHVGTWRACCFLQASLGYSSQVCEL